MVESAPPLKAAASKLRGLIKSWHQDHQYCALEEEKDSDRCCPGKNPSQEQQKCVKGHVPFYVGKDREHAQRFLVKLKHLHHPLFRQLLRWSEEQLQVHVGSYIPCDPALFQNLLWHIETKDSACKDLGMEDELLRFYSSLVPTQA